MKHHSLYNILIFSVLLVASLAVPTGCRERRVLSEHMAQLDSLVSPVLENSEINLNNVKKADSLMALIESVDTSRMSEKQHAQYTLLRAELDYKHYLDTFDLDALNRALIYFEDHEDRERQMRTLFLRSVHEFDANDYIKSITSALRAERIAGQLHDTLFLAKINEHISFIYNRDGNRKSSKEHSYRAAQFYKQYGNQSLFQACMIDYCLMMIELKEYNQAVCTLDSLIPEISDSDTLVLLYAEQTLAQTMLKTGRMDETRSILDRIESYNIDGYPNYILKFEYALKTNDIDSMRVLLYKILESDSPEYHQGIKYQSLYQYDKITGHIDSALFYHEKLYDIYLESMLKTLDQSIVKAESDFNAENARLNERIADRNNLLLIMSLIMLGLVLVAGYFVYRWLNQKRKNEVQEKIDAIDRLFETIDLREQSIAELNRELKDKDSELVRLNRSLGENRAAISAMSEQVNRLYSTQYNLINDIYDEYFTEGKPDDNVKLHVYNRINDILLQMRDRKKTIELQASLDRYCGNVISHLREDFPELKLDDITFLSLLIAGLAPKAVCMICNITTGNFYMKRRRLRQKIEQSGSANIPLYLKYLDRPSA